MNYTTDHPDTNKEITIADRTYRIMGLHGKQSGFARSVRYVVGEWTLMQSGQTLDALLVAVRGRRRWTLQLWSAGASMITDALSEESLTELVQRNGMQIVRRLHRARKVDAQPNEYHWTEEDAASFEDYLEYRGRQ